MSFFGILSHGFIVIPLVGLNIPINTSKYSNTYKPLYMLTISPLFIITVVIIFVDFIITMVVICLYQIHKRYGETENVQSNSQDAQIQK
jgi:membrane-bound ClpP family serine protease